MKTKSTKANATPPEHLKDIDPGAVVDEAREFLDKMTALFAYVDGDPEANGANDDHRRKFNETAANVRSSLDLLGELVAQTGGAR